MDFNLSREHQLIRKMMAEFTEKEVKPNAGSDASKGQTEAKLVGDHYVMNGSKIFITNGYVADVFVVFAMTDKTRGTKGISAFIVESGFPGFSVGKLFTSEHAMKTTTKVVQLFGGYGYTKDYPVERMMRDAKSRKFTRAPVKSSAS